MTKFIVEGHRTVTCVEEFQMEIEAEDNEEALDLGYEILSENPDEDIHPDRIVCLSRDYVPGSFDVTITKADRENDNNEAA